VTPIEETFMKRGAQTAAAIVAGYFLGRTKKMRLALMIAAAGATGRHGTKTSGLLKSGLAQLGDSAELGKLTESVRGELLTAARAAATKAATSRIESVTRRLSDDSGGSDDEASGEETSDEETEEPTSESADETEAAEKPARRSASRRPSRASEDDEPPSRSRPRRRPSSGEGNRRPVRRRRDDAETDSSTDHDDGDGRPRTRARSSAGPSPVRRRGR
jgi:hypothetical protein